MIVRSCGCGIDYSLEGWAALEYCGQTEVPADEGECNCGAEDRHATWCESRAYSMELRHCSCGSTLAVQVR